VIEPFPTDEVRAKLIRKRTVSENAPANEISCKLPVNTTMDDEVKVKISSALSAKDDNLKSDVENIHAQDRTEDKESTTPRAVL
jgi:hypothetical protein